MKQRVQSTIVLLAITLGMLFLSRLTRVLLIAVCGMLCAYELSKNFEKLDAQCTLWVMITYMVLESVLAVLLSLHRLEAMTVLLCSMGLFVFAVYLALFSGIVHPGVSGKGALYTLAGICYPCMLVVVMMLISVSEIWMETMLIACVSCWCCDAFALFGGIRFGKHKLAPHVSPNKTVEGSVSGAISSVVVAVPLYYLLPLLVENFTFSLPTVMLTALLASSMGQIGDLAESLMKRMIGVKDFSNLIPGHGGMFDRIDSILFAVPTAYGCLFLAQLLSA